MSCVQSKKLKNNYTCDPDGLPAIFFKRLESTLVVPLTVVFKQLLALSLVCTRCLEKSNYHATSQNGVCYRLL